MSDEATSTLEMEEPEYRALHRREWVAERIGWLLIAGTLVAALLGLLGPGPLSFRVGDSADGQLSVEYYAVVRYEAPAELRIGFRPPASDTEFVRLAFSRSFTDEITPESITPEPDAVQMLDQDLVYRFRVSNLDKGGRVTYRFKNDSFGWRTYRIGLVSGSEVEISQLVLP